MIFEEFKYKDTILVVEKKEELPSSFKIKSYLQNIKIMEDKNIPQKDIQEVLTHFFNENNAISETIKDSITKIIYCPHERIIIIITSMGKDFISKRRELINSYGWFFFVSKSGDSTQNGPVKNNKKKKSEPVRREERTIAIESYQFEDLTIPLKEKENMRSLYNSKEYNQYLNLMRKKKFPRCP